MCVCVRAASAGCNVQGLDRTGQDKTGEIERMIRPIVQRDRMANRLPAGFISTLQYIPASYPSAKKEGGSN